MPMKQTTAGPMLRLAAAGFAATFLPTSPVAASAGAGFAEAWGFNGSGQLGNGSTTASDAPVTVVGLSGGVTAVAAGEQHSLALQNGGVFAWGYNFNGQLGNGSATGSGAPVTVSGLSSGVTAIAAGGNYSLAVKNGGVYSWGYNGEGQLGIGTTTTGGYYGVNTAVAVSGLSSGVTAIAGGYLHGLALQNGGVCAWGLNNNGELGNGTFTNSSTPVAVSGLSGGVTAIAAGDSHSLAVRNGAAYAWGSDFYGQLGNGATALTPTLVPAAVVALSGGVTAIAGGQYYSLAVQNGGVFAWGYNGDGQLGDGTTSSQSTPVPIDPADLTHIVAVAAAAISSYALSSDGSLWVWGDNTYGELGLGSATTDYLTPQHLLPPGGYVFTSVDANSDGIHAVATLAAVPEPASLSLLAIASLTTLRRLR